MKNMINPALLLLMYVLPVNNITAQYLSWAHSYGDINSDDYTSIATDAAGNLYHSGDFSGTVDVDPGPGVVSFTSTGGSDMCVAKYDANGSLLWAFALTGPGSTSSKIITDGSGNLLVTGSYNSTVDLDPGSGVFNITTTTNAMFMAKYNAAGQFIWGKDIAGTGGQYVNDIASDAAGNIYATGAFTGTCDFDPGAGLYNLTATGGNDEYIVKLDASGNFVWARSRAGISGGSSVANAIAVDAGGNVYTVGSFGGSVDFDPGPGTAVQTSSGFSDGYLSKLSAAGNLMYTWRIAASAGQDIANGLAVDAGSVYVTGLFEQTCDFDLGAGVVQFTANGQADAFVNKYNSTSGALTWAKVLSGNIIELPARLTTDALGNVYTTGSFIGQTDFDPGTGSFMLDAGFSLISYISKLNSSGNFLWAGLLATASSNSPQDIAADDCGNIYLSGIFNDSLDAEPGVNKYKLTGASAGVSDIFFLKLSQSNWTGNVSTDWHNPLNWGCNTLPGVRSNVIIPTGAVRFPVVSANAEVKSITLQPGSSTHVQPGVELKANSGN